MFERVRARKTEMGVAVFMRAYGILTPMPPPPKKKEPTKNCSHENMSLGNKVTRKKKWQQAAALSTTSTFSLGL
jgi:hypothetical protein